MSVDTPLYFVRSLPEGVVEHQEVEISIKRILEEATNLGITWGIIPDTDIVQLVYKDKVQIFRGCFPNTTSYNAAEICYDKQLCKMILKKAGLEVMSGFLLYKEDSDTRIKSMWDSLQKPLVLKPAKGSHGNGVIMNLTDFSECSEKIHQYFKAPLYDGGLILEEMFVGKEYRIMATSEKVLAVMERIPAHVIGDGERTIEQLIEIENDNPIRNISEFIYPHISLNNTSLELLANQKLTPQSVPNSGQHVVLQNISNIMAGGVAIDRTDEVHESVKRVAVEAVRAIPGLSWAGIDFMTKDVYGPQKKDSYTIIEMNSSPGFDMHDMPMQGKPRGVTKEFLYLMFPELR